MECDGTKSGTWTIIYLDDPWHGGVWNTVQNSHGLSGVLLLCFLAFLGDAGIAGVFLSSFARRECTESCSIKLCDHLIYRSLSKERVSCEHVVILRGALRSPPHDQLHPSHRHPVQTMVLDPRSVRGPRIKVPRPGLEMSWAPGGCGQSTWGTVCRK